MIVVQVLLWLAAGWALAGHITACLDVNRRKALGHLAEASRRTMEQSLIAFILALGLLGLLLK